MSTEERRQAAVALISRGVAVIPVPAGEKNPGRRGWEDLRISEEDVPDYWSNGQNVGILCGEPSGWRVDVDLDADEAVKIAFWFLPPTLTGGRENRPHSHCWYVAAGAESHDWKAPDGTKLIELRSTGRQTIVAPSTHPDGDRYVWHSESGLKMAEIPADELEERCRELATAVLVARHVCPEGGRHDYALSIAGFLLRPGRLDEETTLKILRAAWRAAGADTREALRDLAGIVADTARNLAAGEPVVGGPTLEEAAPGIVRVLCKWWGWNRNSQPEHAGTEEKEDRRNQADRLIGYALEDVGELFTDQHGTPHALVDGDPVPLTSRCYPWFRRLMWEEESKAVNGEYLKTAAGTLAAHAEFSGEVRELHTRAAWHEEALYYELRPGKVVRVDSGGWTFEANPPVLFRRYPNLKPLPDPRPGGSVKDLAGYVNLKTNRDKRLVVSYAITAPLPQVARPIFNASGPMGAGKTTIGRIIKRLLDPTVPETVRYDPRDILQKAMHAYILMLDNLSSLSDAAADTFCRFVTGDGDSKRKLYTDDEDVIVELKRALIFNGINVPTDRGDVLDRMLPVELERIPDGDRKTEEQIWELFAQEHPYILGALFDTLSKALAVKPSLKLSRRPRLADWGEYAAAVYEVMGWGAEQFLRDWDEVVKAQNQGTLDGSPVAQAVIKFMEDKEEYSGTSSEIHKKLEGVAESLGVSIARDKAWPKSARWLWRRIKEVLPLLAAAGIEAHRDDTEKASVIAFRKVSTDDSSDSRILKNRVDKGNTAGIRDDDDSSSNSSRASNSRNDSSPDSAYLSASGDTGITGDRYGITLEGPLSANLKLGESTALAELKVRQEADRNTEREVFTI